VEGWNRRGARPPERALVRLVVGALVLSAAIGLAIVGPQVQRGIRRDSALSPKQQRDAAAADFKYSIAALDLFRREVRAGDRFYVDARGPANRFSPDVLSAFLSYDLLPAVHVVRRHDATVIVRYRFGGPASVERFR
jgi:hypothetical protein